MALTDVVLMNKQPTTTKYTMLVIGPTDVVYPYYIGCSRATDVIGSPFLKIWRIIHRLGKITDVASTSLPKFNHLSLVYDIGFYFPTNLKCPLEPM